MKLHRTNLYLLLSDVIFLRQHFGWGWTARLREIIHDHVKALRNTIND